LRASLRPKAMLVDLARVEREYFERRPERSPRIAESSSCKTTPCFE